MWIFMLKFMIPYLDLYVWLVLDQTVWSKKEMFLAWLLKNVYEPDQIGKFQIILSKHGY